MSEDKYFSIDSTTMPLLYLIEQLNLHEDIEILYFLVYAFNRYNHLG